MGRKHTIEEVNKRLEEVEGILKTGQWSRKIARQIAERWGIHLQQVYRDRKAVLLRWTEDETDQSHDEKTAKLVNEMRAVRTSASAKALNDGDGSFLRSAVSLFDIEARVLGLSKPQEFNVRVAQVADPEAMAREVVELLPHAAAILGIEPQQIIEAAYEEVQEPTGDTDGE